MSNIRNRLAKLEEASAEPAESAAGGLTRECFDVLYGFRKLADATDETRRLVAPLYRRDPEFIDIYQVRAAQIIMEAQRSRQTQFESKQESPK